MLLVYSSPNYNVMALIFVNHLIDVDYLPFDQPGTKFEQITKKMRSEIKCLQENVKGRQYI